MKGITFLTLILCIISLPSVLSINIDEGIMLIDKNFDSENKLIVIYGTDDFFAYQHFSNKIFADNVNNLIIKNLDTKFFFLDTDNIDENSLNDKDVIIAGGPCANRYWSKFSEETCSEWPYGPGQSIVKIINNNGHIILLVAGTTKGDTFEIVDKLSNYDTQKIFGQSSSVVYSSRANRTESLSPLCTQNDACTKIPMPCRHIFSTFVQQVDYDFNVGGKNYRIKTENFDYSEDSVDLNVNGVLFKNLKLGDEIKIDDTLNLSACNFKSTSWSGVELAFSKEFVFPYSPTSITNAADATLDIDLHNDIVFIRNVGNAYIKNIVINENKNTISRITINDEEYQNLGVGSSIKLSSGIIVKIIEIEPPGCIYTDLPPEDQVCQGTLVRFEVS